ncbi:MAG: MBL fold metallo-hydrolase [Deltaproteobacteria bacterium]|jgi:metallo-beta-lactamase family protein|nr:MBL fold metallo-hydrolase [Deltaproteobacteria bacterium]
MKIRCLGAIRAVTGSCYQIKNPQEGYTLLDCGLFQGGRQTELRNFNTPVYKPDEVTSIVITHAHMDHSGLAPRLVKAGYRGPIYASEATCDLLNILWEDAAHIQELEATWKTRKNSRQGQKKVDPLYSIEDAQRATKLLKPLSFERDYEISPGLWVRYFPAGHILGAASVMVTAREEKGESRVLFSGDLGRTGQLLIPDPTTPPQADLIFMETTYGNRLHKDLGASVEEFLSVIDEAYRSGGKILIPAFAVERTQEIIFLLAKAWHEGRIPKDLPIILDSPLAIGASEVFIRHPELFDEESTELFKAGHSPLTMSSLRVTRTMAESQKINEIEGSAIIIAGSGMANAGRILHHFKHNLWRPDCHVIFVGFQAQGTTGRRLVEGAEVAKIFREAILVKAKIHTIGGFSGHADQKELVEWLRPQIHDKLTVVLVHGEEAGTLAFETLLRQTFPTLRTRVPYWLETLEVTPDEARVLAAPPAADEVPEEAPYRDSREYRSLAERLERLQRSLVPRDAPFPPNALANLEALLNMAEEIILRRPDA